MVDGGYSAPFSEHPVNTSLYAYSSIPAAVGPEKGAPHQPSTFRVTLPFEEKM
ncbi:MAG: hypothetical protein ABW185_08140 [Sedimenticola sp.]